MKTRFGTHLRIGMTALTVILVTSLTLSLTPVNTVHASDTRTTSVKDEGNPPQGNGTGRGTGVLEKALLREKKANDSLSTLLDKSDKAVTRLEQAITNGQANGRDVSAMEDALRDLNEGITTARIAWMQANDLLANPAGFNENGQVTDRKVALDTIKEIRQVQQEIRKSISDTLRDALKAIRGYCQDNPAD